MFLGFLFIYHIMYLNRKQNVYRIFSKKNGKHFQHIKINQTKNQIQNV